LQLGLAKLLAQICKSSIHLAAAKRSTYDFEMLVMPLTKEIPDEKNAQSLFIIT